MRLSNIAALAILAAGVALTGCGRGNGLPGDLTAHLAAQGITLKPARAEAPISSRAGYLVAQYNPQITTNLISRFSLQSIPSDDPSGDWPSSASAAMSPRNGCGAWRGGHLSSSSATEASFSASTC